MGPNKQREEEALMDSSNSSSTAGIGVAEKEEQEPASLQNHDPLPPKVLGLLYSLLPIPSLLSLRCCSKAHLVCFHAGVNWEPVSQRLVVELHASRLRLETASDVCGPPPAPLPEEEEGMDGGLDDHEQQQRQHHHHLHQHHPRPPPRLVPRPLAVGHRGACGHVQGNSLASFHHAVVLGADMIELDVCIDRSGDLVVHHDRYLPDGRLLDTLTLPEIKRVAPEVEPLSRVLRELVRSGVTLYLDVKSDRVVAPLMRLLHGAILRGGWEARRLLIASFNQYDMIEVNAHRLAYPSTLAAVQTCIIVDGVPISFAKEYAALGVKWCSIGDGCVLPSFLEDAHTRGIGVMVWTVNNPNVMRRYAELGVDALVTDFPERFVAVRKEEEDALLAAQEAATAVAVAAAAAAAMMVGERKREGRMGREEEKAGGEMSREEEKEEEGKDEEEEELQHEQLPHLHHQKDSCSSSRHTRLSMSSAYPAPLHQPRNRLVNALRQTWPLLRALEGRRGNPHTHTPPTPASIQEKRSRLLARQEGEGEGKEGAEEGLVMHLKNAARQAEDSATAVLQPRLPRRRVSQQQQQQQQQIGREEERDDTGGSSISISSSSSSRAPQTARARIKKGKKEEGEGGRKRGEKEEPMMTTRTMREKRFPSLILATGVGEAGRGGEKPTAYGRLKDEGGGDDEAARDWPFLPFERTWAQSSRA